MTAPAKESVMWLFAIVLACVPAPIRIVGDINEEPAVHLFNDSEADVLLITNLAFMQDTDVLAASEIEVGPGVDLWLQRPVEATALEVETTRDPFVFDNLDVNLLVR